MEEKQMENIDATNKNILKQKSKNKTWKKTFLSVILSGSLSIVGVQTPINEIE